MLFRTLSEFSACFREQIGCNPAKNVVNSHAISDSCVIKSASWVVI